MYKLRIGRVGLVNKATELFLNLNIGNSLHKKMGLPDSQGHPNPFVNGECGVDLLQSCKPNSLVSKAS